MGGRGQMSLKRRIIFYAIIIFIIFGIGFYIIIKSPIGQRYLFKGDRITVNLKVFVDDKEVSLNDLIATCKYEKNNCDVTSQNGTYKSAGGDYGLYKFSVTIPKERFNEYGNDILLNFNFLNANNWYISNSDCVISIKTDNNILSGKAGVTVKYNNNAPKSYINDIKSIDNSIDINCGI